MPVYKYKSFKEARIHLLELQPKDPFERLSNLQELLSILRPQKPCQHGIFKFKTLEDANKHRDGQ